MADYLQAPELIVYFYNSFEGPTLEAALNGLADRPHYLIYLDPIQQSTLLHHVEHRVDGRYPGNRWLPASHH